MKHELNDETLTAYALGELDAAETKAVEKLLADAAQAGNDAPRKALEEIRATVTLAEAAFAENAEEHALTTEQRRALEVTASHPTRRFWSRSPLINGLAAAAILAIVAAITVPFPRNSGVQIAKHAEGIVPSATTPDVQPATPVSSAPGVDPLRYQIVSRPSEEPAAPEQDRSAAIVVDKSILTDPQETQQQDTGSAPTQAAMQPVPAEHLSEKHGDGLTVTPDPASLGVDSQSEVDAKAPELAAQGGVSVNGGKLSESEGVRVTAESSAAVTPAKPGDQGTAKTFEWERRQLADSGVPSDRDGSAAASSAEISRRNVVLSPDFAAPAAPAAPGPPALSIAPGNKKVENQYGIPRAEQLEQLESLGYAEPNARFRTAAIDAPRYGSWGAERRVAIESQGSESYKQIVDNGFLRVSDQPLSTFSIDVDTASYSNVRRFLDSGQLPPPDAVRVEELINYFDYAYPAPTDGTPFAAHFEATACPWAPAHTLVRIGLKGREVPHAQRPATNLVFLIDVSGSMQPENKLPLVKRAMAMLTRQLDERDRVSIVTYASGVNLALPVTNASRQDVILSAIDNLGAGGSTNGAGGIQLAYQSARENFLPGGVNRVILATDGDFNVGISDNDSLLSMIQNEAKSNVFLSVFGFGMGNLKDDKLEMLADKGNGVYGYIDSESEARKVFVEELSGTLVTIAKDVKIQVEFNPARVAAYRLIGYENRALAAQDFNDDRKDAGEIGAGHTVTALYEIVPAGQAIPAGTEDTLRYQTGGAAPEAAPQAAAPAASPAHADELMLVKLRYKEPEGAESKLLEFPLKDQVSESPSADLKFASAVAAFGKLLRGNPLGSGLSYDAMMQLAQAGLAASDDPRRAEMIHLMLQARPLIEGR